jgi:hypothetical protein
LILAAALVVAGGTLLLVIRSGDHRTTAHRTVASPSVSPRTPFLLPDPSITISRLGSSTDTTGATALAGQIQTALSGFYDQAFMDPRTWTDGVPPAAWDVFAPDIRARAQQDAESLTLGLQPSRVTALQATQVTLAIRVLIDGSGKARLASVDVTFDATGTIAGGEPLTVTNRATFVFRAVSGHWLVVAYPVANTGVTAEPAASASPPGTPAPSGASP